MDLNTQLKNYAKLIAKVGLNIQKNQPVLVRASTETRDFVAKIVEACYELGAIKNLLNYILNIKVKIL